MNFLQNSQVLATEMRGVASVELTARPYNRFEPETSVWWLIPTTEWPAYKYGKIFIEPVDEGFFCGFYLEKGVSIKDQSIYSEVLNMQADWTWNAFMTALNVDDKNLEKIFSKLVAEEESVYMEIDLSTLPTGSGDSYNDGGSFLEQKESFNSTIVKAQIGKDLKLVNVKIEPNIAQADLARYLGSVEFDGTNIFEVEKILDNIPNSDWTWIDLKFGIYISKNEKKLNLADIWSKYLELWMVWLR